MARKPAAKPKPSVKPKVKVSVKPVATVKSKTTTAAAKAKTAEKAKTSAAAKAALAKRINITPLVREQFIFTGTGPKPAQEAPRDELFLSDFVAAFRRELEAVALIAAPKDSEIPQMHLSEVQLDFDYVISSVTSDGVMIKVRPDQISEAAGKGVHRIGLKFADIDVVSATGLAVKPEKQEK